MTDYPQKNLMAQTTARRLPVVRRTTTLFATEALGEAAFQRETWVGLIILGMWLLNSEILPTPLLSLVTT